MCKSTDLSCGVRLPYVRLFGTKEFPKTRRPVASRAELSCSMWRTTWQLQQEGAEDDKHVTLTRTLARFAQRRWSRR
jgi:hypothetical protein